MKKKEDPSANLDLFITCAQGLEHVLIEELEDLGFPDAVPGYRGVYVQWSSIEDIYRINYSSRIGGRVLMPLLRFRCRDGHALSREAAKVDWLRYIPEGKTFAIDANVSHRELRNSLFAAQLFKDVICDQFREKTGSRPNVDTKNPDVQLNLFIHEELAIISIDTSGSPLHKRGYRQEGGDAPIQESLAAALLRLARYKGDEIVYDPCCGSGTILIEAALIASHTPPGFLRQQWGFMYLPEFSHDAWLKVKNEYDSKRIALPRGLLWGTDVNKNAVRISKGNLRAIGLHQAVEIAHSDFRDWIPPVAPNFVISNPPHGKRMEDVDFLKPFYRDLGDFMKQKTAKPAVGFIFTANTELTKEVGLAARRRHVIDNSGIDSRLLEFELY